MKDEDFYKLILTEQFLSLKQRKLMEQRDIFKDLLEEMEKAEPRESFFFHCSFGRFKIIKID